MYNEQWLQLLPYVDSVIIADREFYLDAARKFTVTVVEDETDKREQPFETVLEQSFAEQMIKDPKDLIAFFLHVASHQRCDVFWKRCPVPMEQFTAIQLDLIEEVYNQRLVSTVAPTYYDAFPKVNAAYDVYKGFDVAKRRPLQTMFTTQCQTGMVELDQLHTMLYSLDPLNHHTFTTYMVMWQFLLKDSRVSTLIEQYES